MTFSLRRCASATSWSIGQSSGQRIDPAIVGDVVSEVRHRRWVDRRNPDGIHAEPCQIAQRPTNSRQVADPVAIGIAKRSRVDLVNNAPPPPGRLRRAHAVWPSLKSRRAPLAEPRTLSGRLTGEGCRRAITPVDSPPLRKIKSSAFLQLGFAMARRSLRPDPIDPPPDPRGGRGRLLFSSLS